MNTAVFRLLAQSEDYIRRCLEYAKIYLAIRRDQVAWIAPHLMVDRNPMSGVKFFPEAIKTRFLTDDEIARLRHLMEPRVWEMVAFAIETGLRRSEQFNLRWSQIDMENRVLSLPMPKGSKSRYVPLTDGVCGLLSRWDSFTKSPFVFPGKDPLKPLDARSFVRWYFDPALRRAGIVGASWHSLRHTAATRRVLSGASLYGVQQLLGHRDIKTTARYS
ncbi:MAG TPA: site-specific integrase, partial [Nitrospira sp.]|nr:site-specific integrase [Nitrospira sp.]